MSPIYKACPYQRPKRIRKSRFGFDSIRFKHALKSPHSIRSDSNKTYVKVPNN